MKFATLRDGSLLIVSRDQTRAVRAAPVASSLLDALQRWDAVALPLADLYESLNAGGASGAFGFDPSACTAPLPRSPQWLDGSAFLNHGRLLEEAFNTLPIPLFDSVPVM